MFSNENLLGNEHKYNATIQIFLMASFFLCKMFVCFYFLNVNCNMF